MNSLNPALWLVATPNTNTHFGLPEGFYLIALAVMCALGFVALPRRWREESPFDARFPRGTRGVLAAQLAVTAATGTLFFFWLGDSGAMARGPASFVAFLFLIATLVWIGLFLSVAYRGKPQRLLPPRFRDGSTPVRARRGR